MNRQLAGEQVRKLVLATNFGYSDQSARELMRVIATPFIKNIISTERERKKKKRSGIIKSIRKEIAREELCGWLCIAQKKG